MEYFIYCDESEKKGKHFSNFYGGCLIRSYDFEKINQQLINLKKSLNLQNELKWQRVSANYLPKYIEMINLFFQFIKENKIKIRIMFTSNIYQAQNLTDEQKDNEYHILYYQFLKHAFGLRFANDTNNDVLVRVYLDDLPDANHRNKKLMDYLASLDVFPPFRKNNIRFQRNQIAEVNSKKHILMQCLDIILGSIQFRLNDLHKEKPSGSRIRGKRTIAKEKLYKFINTQIRDIYPNFNIGISTGLQEDTTNKWNHPYRHWLFIPADHEIQLKHGKKR